MPESAIFTAAVKLPPDQRAAYLDRACAGDAELRREVESLLRAHDASGDFLPTRPPATEASEPIAEGPGTVIGPYKLMEQIGEGGFGLVFVAEQQHPVRRKVALKIIKPGMDSKQVLARFEAERQALAMMDHPNIAKVLDAGATDSGRPYFVMELVHGIPITEFCDANKLPPRQRLELFVAVCQAVQHAHQKGIIHRDLKPSNILVTMYDDRPVPKVIDFGIAKAIEQRLTDRTVYTQFGTMVGTFEYMSPEQAEMNAFGVDTRSDVYSLGVLLYELLTGTTPLERQRLRQAAFDEIRRLIKEEEPPRPSTRLSTSAALAKVAAARRTEPGKLSAQVEGDLDWIVMKALEKDRTRRYETASSFAADVRRFLAEEPVEARPPSAWYRFRKFARRNKAALTTAALVAASLVAGLAASVWQAVRATDAEWRAALDRDAALIAGKEATEKGEAARELAEKLLEAQEKRDADQYVWDLRAVPLLVEAGNITDAAGLLDRHVPKAGPLDRRGFEWYYWHRQLNAHAAAGRLPDVPGDGLAWAASEDGSRLAWVGKGGDGAEVRVWDVPTRRLLRQHPIPLDSTGGVGLRLAAYRPLFSRDGKRLAVHVGLVGVNGPWPHGRVVLDVATGRELLRPTGDSRLGAGLIQEEVIDALSPDGRRFAAVSAGRVRVWDVDSGQEVCGPLPGRILAHGAFSPDGSRLVTIQQPSQLRGRSVVVGWDVATGEELVRWEVSELGGRGEDVTLSPDGRRAVAVRAAPGGWQLVVWDAETGQESHALPLPKLDMLRGVPQHFFSPDGSRLATLRSTFAPNSTVGIRPVHLTLCDLEAGTLLPPLEGTTNARFPLRRPGVTFTPDGKRLVFPSGNVLRTWDAATGKPHQTLRGHALPVEALAFAVGGRLRSVESDGALREWDIDPPGPFVLPLAGFEQLFGGTEAFAVSPDGSRVATGTAADADRNGPRAVWVTDRAGRLIRQLDLPAGAATFPVHRLALDRAGRRVVAVLGGTVGSAAKDQGHRLVVWDVVTGAVLLERSMDGFVPSVMALSPDGETVVLSGRTGRRGTLRVFAVDGGQERPEVLVEGITSEVHFSPDGRRLLVGFYSGSLTSPVGRVLVHDLVSGKTVVKITPNDGTSNAQLAWAPDGSRFAVATPSPRLGVRQSAITLYDATTGELQATLEASSSDGFSVGYLGPVFSPDGRRLAAFTSLLGPVQVKVWDVASGRELLTLRPATSWPADAAENGWQRLAFFADGLLLAESGGTNPLRGGRVLALTTWDATPPAAK